MSNQYLFTYCDEMGNGTLGFGSLTITQETYSPINQAVIDDAVRIVKEMLKLLEDTKVVPLAFHRFEK